MNGFRKARRFLAALCLVVCGVGAVKAGTVEIGPHEGPAGPPYSGTSGNYLSIQQVFYSYNGSAWFTPGNASAPLLTGAYNSATGDTAFRNSSLFNSTTGEYIGSNANRPRLAVGQTLTVEAVLIDTNGATAGGNFLMVPKPLSATVTNFNYPMNLPWGDLSGIFASLSGNRTNIATQNPSPPHTPNNPAWITAAQNVLNSADINSMLAHDSGGMLNAYDYDVLFANPIAVTDYVLVAERNGNTYFELTPLDSSGNVITGANILRFGFPTGAAHTRYDFRTGVIAAGDAGIGNGASGQDHAMSVAAASLFFDTTFGATASEQPIYGFRVNNDGQADVLFFGLTPIPEPGTGIVSALAVGFLATRRFGRKARRAAA